MSSNRTRRFVNSAIALMIVFTILGAVPVRAQDSGPVQPPAPTSDPYFDGDQQLWFDSGSQPAADPTAGGVDFPGAASPGAPTGNDSFGYGYSAAAVGWISALPAAGGTNTGLQGAGGITNAIALPFDFKFYENTYNKVYISANGYLTFTGGQFNDNQSPLKYSKEPNNIIAPFWGPVTLGSGASELGQVFYRAPAGSAPNRTFVVQWNQITKSGANFTFEVILYENGNIVLQYGGMNYSSTGGYYCTTSGIENSRGDDGLVYDRFCTRSASNHDVLFTRPLQPARLLIAPAKNGQFVGPGQTASFEVSITNTGDQDGEPVDTYEISSASLPNPLIDWPVSLFNAATLDPLVDTNSSGGADTGAIAQGDTFKILALVQVPSQASVHDSDKVTITAVSTLDETQFDSSEARLVIPAPFVSGYAPLDSGIMSLDFVEPQGQTTISATANGKMGTNTAVAEAANGNIFYAWNVYRCLSNNNPCTRDVWEVEYVVYNRDGQLVRGVTKVADHSSVSYSTYDRFPAIAASSSGVVSIAWVRSASDSQARFTDNVVLQRFNQDGLPTGSLVNITQNTVFTSPAYFDPAISAAGSTNFVVAWTTETTSAPNNISNITTAAVTASTGAVARAAHALTSSTTGGVIGYSFPSLAKLAGSNVFLVYQGWDKSLPETNRHNIYYQELNNLGNLLRGPYTIDTALDDQYPDAVQLSGGGILVAWQNNQINYAILNGANGAPYSYQKTPTAMELMANERDMSVSVTADSQGNGILSWADSSAVEQHQLYYAAVNGAGTQTGGPMIYKTSEFGISTSNYGNTITSHTFTASTPLVDLSLSGERSIFLAPGTTTATIVVEFTNLGQTTADGVVLTATLPVNAPPLVVTDTTPDTTGVCTSICTWNLEDVAFQDVGRIEMTIQIAPINFGTSYPIQFSISSTNADANPSNNTRIITVFPAQKTLLPFVFR